ncbi:MAG: hypothetical protein ACRDBL_04680 [Rhabdaerophilum sp.]
MKLLILGPARHGKDTAAEYLRDAHGVSFQSSSLFLAETVVRPALAGGGIFYDSIEACYADRVNHRALWREIIADFNGDDPARLAKAILAVSDCYVGMRTERELWASRSLFDAILWIDASGRGVPPEGADSMEISFDPAWMARIDNGGTVEEMRAQLDDWVRVGSWVRPK